MSQRPPADDRPERIDDPEFIYTPADQAEERMRRLKPIAPYTGPQTSPTIAEVQAQEARRQRSGRTPS